MMRVGAEKTGQGSSGLIAKKTYVGPGTGFLVFVLFLYGHGGFMLGIRVFFHKIRATLENGLEEDMSESRQSDSEAVTVSNPSMTLWRPKIRLA